MTLLVLVAIGLFGLRLASGESAIDISKRPDNMPVQSGWRTPFPNPVLPAGSLYPRALWNDPTLLREGDQYVMWMTTSIETPFKPPIVPFRAVSDDKGKTWRLDPPTPVATPDGTRFVNIETPTVVKFHGMYHMYFSGIYPDAKPTLMAIGHAVSPDGKSWKVSRDPVLSESGNLQDWNGFMVGEPGAIVRGDEIFVYFSAVGARASGVPPQDQSIGLAVTKDGEHFGPQLRVLTQASIYPPEKGFAGYSTPSPFELHGRVHLLFDVVLSLKGANPDWQQVALHHAYSVSDGRGDFVQDDKPIFTRNSFPWTLGEVIGPSALVDEGKVKMWFGGHVPIGSLGPLVQRGYSGNEFGINYAEKDVTAFVR
jgi:hypothetical protein